MQSLIRRLLGRTSLPPLPRPKVPICVIGDIHGCLELLDQLLGQIANRPEARIVILGDMIDRGPDSAGVLARLHALQTSAPERVTCLMGNHERMMLDFLTSPDVATQWLRYGGAETTASYGLNPREGAQRLSTALSEVIPGPIRQWLTHLPTFWSADGLGAVHAGADPALPLHRQLEDTLLWGHRDFARRARPDGLWIAYGHTIVPAPLAQQGRLALDTGAWRSGVLSAAWLDKDGLTFLQANQSIQNT